jgi:hypothetical protein
MVKFAMQDFATVEWAGRQRRNRKVMARQPVVGVFQDISGFSAVYWTRQWHQIRKTMMPNGGNPLEHGILKNLPRNISGS